MICPVPGRCIDSQWNHSGNIEEETYRLYHFKISFQEEEVEIYIQFYNKERIAINGVKNPSINKKTEFL